MTKLKPLAVNTTIAKRILRGRVGDGFFLYKSGANEYGVIDMCIGPRGEVLDTEGNPLVYTCADGTETRYRVVIDAPTPEAPPDSNHGFIEPELAAFLDAMAEPGAFLEANQKRLVRLGLGADDWQVSRVGTGELLHQGDLLTGLQELEDDK